MTKKKYSGIVTVKFEFNYKHMIVELTSGHYICAACSKLFMHGTTKKIVLDHIKNHDMSEITRCMITPMPGVTKRITGEKDK